MFRMIVVIFSLLVSIGSYSAIVKGNPKGQVTMIEIYDYQCPHCHQAFPIVQKLIANNPNLKLRLMPVAIMNKTSIYEAAAAISATKYQGAFQKFTDIAMSGNPLTKTEVDNALKNIGLTSPRFIAMMHSKAVENQMMEGLKFLRLEHSGTPLFIVYPTNNPHVSKVIEGSQAYSALQRIIDHASHT